MARIVALAMKKEGVQSSSELALFLRHSSSLIPSPRPRLLPESYLAVTVALGSCQQSCGSQ